MGRNKGHYNKDSERVRQKKEQMRMGYRNLGVMQNASGEISLQARIDLVNLYQAQYNACYTNFAKKQLEKKLFKTYQESIDILRSQKAITILQEHQEIEKLMHFYIKNALELSKRIQNSFLPMALGDTSKVVPDNDPQVIIVALARRRLEEMGADMEKLDIDTSGLAKINR